MLRSASAAEFFVYDSALFFFYDNYILAQSLAEVNKSVTNPRWETARSDTMQRMHRIEWTVIKKHQRRLLLIQMTSPVISVARGTTITHNIAVI